LFFDESQLEDDEDSVREDRVEREDVDDEDCVDDREDVDDEDCVDEDRLEREDDEATEELDKSDDIEIEFDEPPKKITSSLGVNEIVHSEFDKTSRRNDPYQK